MSTYSNNALREKSCPPVRGRSEFGFNLIELLMSMALATVIFMAITTLFVRQGELMQQQNELIMMNREARFGLDHLRSDLTSLGSNTTPNSAVDPLVCQKPNPPLRVLQVDTTNGYVAAANLNPNVVPTSLTLFGSLDVKTRFKTATIEGTTVRLVDDGKLPATQAGWDEIFATDRYLRITGADGQQFFAAIAASSQGSGTVTVVANIPRVGNGNPCGYTGLGANYTVDVQNFVRYRIVADSRPGVPLDKAGKALQSLLVRERLGLDSIAVTSQTILVENAVDLQIYDIGIDNDPLPESLKISVFRLADEVFLPGGGGILGNQAGARPEALRFMTVKLSVRTTWPKAKLIHRPREVFWQPLDTFLLPDEVQSAHQVISVASRVAFPTLVSRNL